MANKKIIFVKDEEELQKRRKKSTWFCDSDIAKEHKKNCKKDPWNCGKCIWIDESSNAMSEYGAQIVVEEQPHPLTNYIIDKFNGREI
tara:strand:- start:260 stop:523 length:264 start_codon:yes stop_codon:yes gene_type:complete